jgi:hypothetical protein
VRPNWTKDYRKVCGEREELEAFARDGVAGTASQCSRCLGSPLGPRRSLSGYLETWRRIGVWPDSVQVPGGTLSHSGCPPVSLVWLSFGLRSRRAPCEERLERGLPSSK